MTSPYEAVIGLEVHCQLATQSKIFAPDPQAFGAPPNTLVSEISLGLPGVLPVLNRKVVEYAVLAGLALDCPLRPVSRFARKNYVYPDLPKGYQISQFDAPLCEHGHLDFTVEGKPHRCAITRIHLEEDAGKSLHEADPECALLDFNRAGTALIEIVSEPDLRSAAQAVAYLRELHAIVTFLGICDGNMEQGSFRCDANVSIRPRGDTRLYTRTELKNLNSFKFIEAAVEHEIARQIALVSSGGTVHGETRLWDEKRQTSRVMRRKEQADDYRYFPDPDLPPLVLEPSWIDALRERMPELPAAKRTRYQDALGLPAYDAGVLTQNPERAALFDATVAAGAPAKPASNLIMTEVLRLAGERSTPVITTLSGAALAELIDHLETGTLTRTSAFVVLEHMLDSNRSPTQIIDEEGLTAVSDADTVGPILDALLEREAAQVERYRKGAKKLFGFFMGQAMRALQGQGDPAVIQKLLREKLG